MKEKDSIPKTLTDLGLTTRVRQELRFNQAELAKAFRPIEEMGILARENLLGLQRFTVDFAASPLFKEMSIASSAISPYRDMPEFRVVQADATRISELAAGIGKELALTLAPIRSAIAEIQLGFTTQLDASRQAFEARKLGHESWFHDFEPIAVDIAKIAKINFAIPESALLRWSSEVLADRTTLLKDCMLNTAALQQFYAATPVPKTTVSADQLLAASQLVLDHAEVVRHLPPRLIVQEDEWAAEDKKHRDEELGAKLEIALRDFDERLLELRRQAWRNLAAGNVSAARLGMAGIRELFTDVLHSLAPDAEVKKTANWLARSKEITRPTRRMRLDYVLGDEAASEADALLQFSESVNRTQRFVHAFADDVEIVRIHMGQMESWVYLLLLRGKRHPRSN